jgi:hypothetical protein
MTELASSSLVRVDSDDLASVVRRGPMRYIDPAAWLVRQAVERALTEAPAEYARPGSIGIVGVSEHATLQSLREVAHAAAEGSVSPLRFIAASPGTLLGLCCAEFGFRGPSLLLTMPLERGLEVARTLARGWLSGSSPAATAVAMTTYSFDEVTGHSATCQLLALPQPLEETTSL